MSLPLEGGMTHARADNNHTWGGGKAKGTPWTLNMDACPVCEKGLVSDGFSERDILPATYGPSLNELVNEEDAKAHSAPCGRSSPGNFGYFVCCEVEGGVKFPVERAGATKNWTQKQDLLWALDSEQDKEKNKLKRIQTSIQPRR